MICSACNGTGKHVIRGAPGRCNVKPVSAEPCPRCGGSGFEHHAQSGEYDRDKDAIGSWFDAIGELRRRHVAGEPVRDLPLFKA